VSFSSHYQFPHGTIVFVLRNYNVEEGRFVVYQIK
jgi:hypothetical protein